MQTLQALLNFALAWYNLPFTLALMACLVLSLLQFVGLGDDDADSDMDGDADGDMDGDDHEGLLEGLLHSMGLGHAPLTIVLLLLTAITGLLGWSLTGLIFPALVGSNTLAVLIIWGVVLAISIFLTGRLARLFSRMVPAVSTTATRRVHLVGQRGRVISPAVDGSYGQVRLRDPGGTMLTVFAITPGGSAPISRDTEVVLVDFDDQRRLYTVVPLDLDR